MLLTDKQKLKHKAKCEIKKLKHKKNYKFIIGNKYVLIYKFNNKKIKRIFVCKQIIHTIKDKIINGVVMQQINNTYCDGIKYYLNKEDCKKYHIKYYNNLQLFSMKENFKNYE